LKFPFRGGSTHVLNSGLPFNYHGFTIIYLDRPYIHLLYPIYWRNPHFSRLGASRLLHLYWFRGFQGGTPSKPAPREPSPIGLGGSTVTVVTLRSCIPNFALLYTQFHIHSAAATGNATHHTILHTLSMQRISQRTRVPSRKAQANESLFTICENPAEGTSIPNLSNSRPRAPF
jgi:hypothetical protein